jgi:pimeloyl-ACP methyl ester carboxylesterase
MSAGVFRGGAGEPLVLIHIGANPWHKWEPVLPQLTARYDVLIPTLPGWKGGPKLSDPVTLETLVDGVATAMDAAGWTEAHLVGNSVGVWISFELARRGRARSVLALSPAGGWTPRGARRLRRFFLWNKRLTAVSRPFVSVAVRFGILRRVFFRLIVAHPERLTRVQATHMAKDTMAGDLKRMQTAIFDNVVTQYPDLGVPALVAWCELDRVTPLRSHGEAWRRAAPKAEWRILPDVGHVPMFDDPELVARTMLAHFEGAAAQSSRLRGR